MKLESSIAYHSIILDMTEGEPIQNQDELVMALEACIASDPNPDEPVLTYPGYRDYTIRDMLDEVRNRTGLGEDFRKFMTESASKYKQSIADLMGLSSDQTSNTSPDPHVQL